MVPQQSHLVQDLVALADISLQCFAFVEELLAVLQQHGVLLECLLELAYDVMVVVCDLILACFLGRSVILAPSSLLVAIALSIICPFRHGSSKMHSQCEKLKLYY